jgi:hypothetical protein
MVTEKVENKQKLRLQENHKYESHHILSKPIKTSIRLNSYVLETKFAKIY